MGQRIVPVHMGSPRFQSLELDGLRLTATEFPASVVLQPHVHDRTVIAVMVDGFFDLLIRNRTFPCPPATVLVEPGGERHSNKVRRSGARTLVIEPTPLYEMEQLGEFRQLLGAPGIVRHAAAWAAAARLRAEVCERTAGYEMVVEEQVLRLLSASVGQKPDAARAAIPRWLQRAREIVHESPLENLRVRDISADVGVHPVYLTKLFREYFGVSLGTYQRRRRLAWAAEQLALGEAVAEVAHRAGFADQAHFTRAFKRFSGRTPARFRALRRAARDTRAISSDATTDSDRV